MDVTILVHILSLSMIIQKVSSIVVKTIPEDQEYAEHYFLHPDEKADDTKKTCLRNDLRYNTNVCDIPPELFMEMCKEVVEVESIRTLYTMFILDPNQIPEPCKNCTVKLYRTKTSENAAYQVQARQCPTLIGGHPLWVSKGYEVGSIFVYNENYISDEKLRVEDYIVFLDKTDEPLTSVHAYLFVLIRKLLKYSNEILYPEIHVVYVNNHSFSYEMRPEKFGIIRIRSEPLKETQRMKRNGDRSIRTIGFNQVMSFHQGQSFQCEI